MSTLEMCDCINLTYFNFHLQRVLLQHREPYQGHLPSPQDGCRGLHPHLSDRHLQQGQGPHARHSTHPGSSQCFGHRRAGRRSQGNRTKNIL